MNDKKELTQKDLSCNLMMHAGYWKDAYTDSLADLIHPDNKRLINTNLNAAKHFKDNK